MYNRFQVIGRLTKDVELKTKGETFYTFVSIASNPGGNRDNTIFLDILLFDENAKTVADNLSKGDMLFVEGVLLQSKTGQNIRLVGKKIVPLPQRKNTEVSKKTIRSEIEELASYIPDDDEDNGPPTEKTVIEPF